MYKVLLVDDEALIREAISENTKWNELGFELIGTCKNGKEAADFIQKNPPDLLITDIYMPRMDGIELTEYVYNNYRDMKVVIISGYDEFEYAKKAVKYQVKEYILKPITPRELAEILTNIRKDMDEERKSEADIRRIQDAFQRNLRGLQERFLIGLLHGDFPEGQIVGRTKELQLNLEGPYFAAAIFEEDDTTRFLDGNVEENKGLSSFAIFNVANEIMSEEGIGYAIPGVQDETLLIFQGERGIIKKTEEICERIQKYIQENLGIDSTVGIGTETDLLSDLQTSFENARLAVDYRFQMGTNHVIPFLNVDNQEKMVMLPIKVCANEIVKGIRNNSREELASRIHEFIQKLRDANQSRNFSMFYVQNLLLHIVEILGIQEFQNEELARRGVNFLQELFQKKHLSEVEGALIEFCSSLGKILLEEREDLWKKQAWMAVKYIEENYGDSSISLNSVCTYLSLSTSYFSSIFKKYTGETFIEALTKKRIEKAMQLIDSTSKRAYEIADEVGYSDPHYFSASFKKMTGMTPTEYAKKRDRK